MATADIDTYKIALGKATILKDPQAVLDYAWNWAEWLSNLGSDVISTAEFFLEDTLVQTNAAYDDTTATCWISGGTEGKTHRATCRITTTAGRVDERSIFLKIIQR